MCDFCQGSKGTKVQKEVIHKKVASGALLLMGSSSFIVNKTDFDPRAVLLLHMHGILGPVFALVSEVFFTYLPGSWLWLLEVCLPD